MNYNDLIYESRPVKFKNYISNKYNLVHQQLYEDALKKYVNNYISNIIFKKLLYELFTLFNNFVYAFDNDPNEIHELINYDYIKNYLHNKKGTFLTLNNVKENYVKIIGEDNIRYYDNFISHIFNKKNNNIKNILYELGINDSDSRLYVKYFLINILYVIEFTKRELYEVFINSNYQSSLNLTSIFDISDFIIKYKNSIYISSENSDFNETGNLTLFRDESLEDNMPEYVLIYDEVLKNEIHIGYTNDGRIILDIDENINIDDIISELSKVMNKTNINLKLLMSESIYNDFYSNHKIIEVKNTEYWKPSSVIIYNRKYPYTKNVVDLSPYWNMYQEYAEKKLTTIKLTNENILDSKIKELDYLRGKAKMYSKMNDMEYYLDFDYLDKDIEIDEEMITDTFTYKYNNL